VWARNITSCLIAFGLVTLVFICISTVLGGLAGQGVSVGPYVFSKAALEPWSARAYVLLMAMTGGALMLVSLSLIRAVFADLAKGNIFCAANVRRIRHLGWLTIAAGICLWLLPLADAAYSTLTGHGGIVFREEPAAFAGLGQVVNGALYLLASWIMAVGLGVREDAEELQRDAELVI
jgi:hypothetical protein